MKIDIQILTKYFMVTWIYSIHYLDNLIENENRDGYIQLDYIVVFGLSHKNMHP